MFLPGPDWYQIINPYWQNSVETTSDLRAQPVPLDRTVIGRQNPGPTIYMYDDTITEPDDGENIVRITGETVGAWKKIGGSAANNRETIPLVGVYDGENRIFTFWNGEKVLYLPPSNTIALYHNGRRLRREEYRVFESVMGSGFDTIEIISFIPQPKSVIFADYTAIG